ncbi:pilus assembly protein TadG-related protein [Raineyella sp.]|uniref:pilus assembly protein TadG-related protein n=1 Tax=Raineyella sp. TaxID=1911550 RepID=UPI002B216599|nr:pilus assembly protein TadG-related protein [Raineyella sp.]MEA5052651.1 pilus assembly protein [Propionicimonas sp.]MEA5155647.1 pilus assembly protein [Raineyella sp.]
MNRQPNRDPERGSISLWVVLASFCMILVVGIAADFSGQAAAEHHARVAAGQAARAAGQAVQLDALVRGGDVQPDPARAAAAGNAHLTQAGLSGTVSMTGTVVNVTVTDTYDCVFLSVIGIRTLPVSGTASADVVRAYEGAPR